MVWTYNFFLCPSKYRRTITGFNFFVFSIDLNCTSVLQSTDIVYVKIKHIKTVIVFQCIESQVGGEVEDTQTNNQ